MKMNIIYNIYNYYMIQIDFKIKIGNKLIYNNIINNG